MKKLLLVFALMVFTLSCVEKVETTEEEVTLEEEEVTLEQEVVSDTTDLKALDGDQTTLVK